MLSVVVVPVVVGQSLDMIFVRHLAGDVEAAVSVTMSVGSTIVALLCVRALAMDSSSIGSFFVYFAVALAGMYSSFVAWYPSAFVRAWRVLLSRHSARAPPRAAAYVLCLAPGLIVAALAILELDRTTKASDAPAVLPLTDIMPTSFLELSAVSNDYPSFAIIYAREAANLSDVLSTVSPYRLVETRNFSHGGVAYMLAGWHSMQNVVATHEMAAVAERVSAAEPSGSCMASRELNARSTVLLLHRCVRWVAGAVIVAIALIHGPVACGITSGVWGVLVLSDLAWTGAVHIGIMFVHTFSISLIVDYVMHAIYAPPDSRVVSALGHSMMTSVIAIVASTNATSIRIVHECAHRIAAACVASWCAGILAALSRRRGGEWKRESERRLHSAIEVSEMVTP